MARLLLALSLLALATGLNASKDVHKLQIGVKVTQISEQACKEPCMKTLVQISP